MKDKELRKLLKEKGIVLIAESGELWSSHWGFHECQHQVLCEMVEDLKSEVKTLTWICTETSKKWQDLEAKFDAINEHYGVTVEHEDAKYTVKEGK